MKDIHQQLGRNKAGIARVLLAVFVMAWVNLVVQAPLHAAMKMNHDMPCHCTHDLCDTVLAMQDQADDGLNGTAPVLPAISAVFVLLPVFQAPLPDQQISLADSAFRDTSPPPLRITGILRI